MARAVTAAVLDARSIFQGGAAGALLAAGDLSDSGAVKLYSVVVAYHPKQEELESLCRALLRSRSGVVIVDNTEASTFSVGGDLSTVTVIPLGENTGIAHALNVGIKHAIEQGAETVILFDQDSKVAEGFLSTLVAPLKGGRPGVVAPVAFDKGNGIEYPSERLTARGSPRNVYSNGRSTPYAVDLVITSGCAATAATFEKVGAMDEDLFIDYVDYEWCLRCRSKGVPILVVPAAVMQHAIGEMVVKRGFYRGIVHGPARTYYKIRNSFLLFRKPHVPWLFSARQVASAIVHNLIQLAFVQQKGAYLRTFCVATLHGLSGVTGKRPGA